MARPTATVVEEGSDTTNGNSWSTASWAPTSGKSYLVFVSATEGNSSNLITALSISGNTITWTEVLEQGDVDGSDRMAVYHGVADGSATTGAITITATSTATNDGAQWCVVELDQEVTVAESNGSNGSGSSGSISIVDAGSESLTIAHIHKAGTEDPAPGTGGTEIAGTNLNLATPNRRDSVQTLDTATDTSATWDDWTQTRTRTMTIVEVQPAGGSPINVAVGQASETDSALAASIRKDVAVGQASETDAALGVTARHDVAVGLASETDAALSVTPRKIVHVGIAEETDSALSVTPSGPSTVAVGIATETDTALGVTIQKIVAVGIATETDTALGVTPRHDVAVGQATEADTALAVTPRKDVAVGLATETDEALAVTPASDVIVNVGIATETDEALAITVRQPIVVSVGIATETDEALSVTFPQAVTVSVGIASEDDEALEVIPEVRRPLESASYRMTYYQRHPQNLPRRGR